MVRVPYSDIRWHKEFINTIFIVKAQTPTIWHNTKVLWDTHAVTMVSLRWCLYTFSFISYFFGMFFFLLVGLQLLSVYALMGCFCFCSAGRDVWRCVSCVLYALADGWAGSHKQHPVAVFAILFPMLPFLFRRMVQKMHKQIQKMVSHNGAHTTYVYGQHINTKFYTKQILNVFCVYLQSGIWKARAYVGMKRRIAVLVIRRCCRQTWKFELCMRNRASCVSIRPTTWQTFRKKKLTCIHTQRKFT